MEYKATYYVVASTGVYVGHGFSNSPKKARRQAETNGWDALAKGDAEANYCSGISVEGWSLYRGATEVYSYCDLDDCYVRDGRVCKSRF
jgi:hypothetical protein